VTVETWTNVLSASGTVAAAAVAAYAAGLAYKQVRFQFVPRLLVQSGGYQIRTTASLKDDFWWSPPTEKARYANGGSEDYRFTLLNVGNGFAFNIRVFVELDYMSIYEDVMRKLAPFHPDLTINYDNFGCQVRDKGEVLGGFRLPDEAFGVVDVIGPANTPERTKQFMIDPNLSFFVTCYAQYVRAAHEIDPEARKPQLIPLLFRIEYLDASGERKCQRQPMELVVRGGQYANDGSDGVSLIGLYETAKH
jgi:hypothetical protein